MTVLGSPIEHDFLLRDLFCTQERLTGLALNHIGGNDYGYGTHRAMRIARIEHHGGDGEDKPRTFHAMKATLRETTANSICRSLPRIPRFYAGEPFHVGGPVQESDEFVLFPPQEAQKLKKANVVHLYAGVGLYAPAQVRTPPRGQVMTARCVPEETEDVPHVNSIAGLEIVFFHEMAEAAITEFQHFRGLGLHAVGSPQSRL